MNPVRKPEEVNFVDVIRVSDLEKRYGSVKAVDGISFSVERGEVFSLLGPNGAGKTTTIEILIGLRERDRGKVEVLGFDPARNPDKVKERIGVQLQEVSLYPHLTVREIAELFASFYPSSRPVDEILAQVGLENRKNVQTRQLSGGQRQRLALALAIINDRAEIVFMDEPTSGLDPQSRRRLWDVILNLREKGCTVFLTTHYMEEAERLSDRVAIIDAGKIIALGSPRQLISEYFNEQAIEFHCREVVRAEEVKILPGVTRVQTDKNGQVTLYSQEVAATISGLLKWTGEKGSELSDVTVRRATLEDVFLRLTGRRIRD